MTRHGLIHRHRDTDADAAPPTGDTTAGERRPGSHEHLVPVTPHERYGGTNWGACFFGWLVAVGVTVLLAAVTSAVATAVGANLNWSLDAAEENAGAVGLAAAIAIAVIMFVGYYAGGYVAGRMSRFDAARQGLGVWLIGILAVAIAVGVTAAFGTRYDVLGRLDLPSVDLTDSQLTLGAVVTCCVLLVVMLIGALAGSAVGRRYHRRIDAVIVEHRPGP